MGGITEIATSAPGYSSVRPNTAAPLAETLKLNGYSTAQFGKCHEVPVWETSPMGPFNAWPSSRGVAAAAAAARMYHHGGRSNPESRCPPAADPQRRLAAKGASGT
jgi:arylsulfatase A-like enzyme